MKTILFYAFLIAGQATVGTQEFDDQKACELARDTISDQMKGSGFCTPKGTEEAPAPTTTTPPPASGSIVSKAPTARK